MATTWCVETDLAISLFKEKDFRFITEVEDKTHEKQKEALYILTDDITEELGYGGAAGGAKSWTGGSWITFMALCYPDTKWFIGREELTRLIASTFITLKKVFKTYGLREGIDWTFNGKYNYIKFSNGSQIDFLDVKFKPRDPQFERFGSLEYTGGWLEEGGEIHSGAYDTLRTRVGRHNNDKYRILGKLLVTLNPKKNWCHTVFWKPFKAGLLPANVKFLQALVTDNPYVDSGYIEKLRAINDKVRKQRLLYGNFDYDDDDNALMDYDSIMDIFNNDFVLKGYKYITGDVARFGNDKSVIMLWEGWRVLQIHVLVHKKTTEVAAFIKQLAHQHKVPMSQVVVDDDGVGGGVVDILGCKGFVNGSSPMSEPDTPRDRGKKIVPNYLNLRSQCYYRLAMRVNEKGLYLAVDEYELKETISEELEQVKKKEVDNDKKLQVVQKKDMKEMLGRSPDFADTIMMREYFELRPSDKPQENLDKYF
jgi:phage terminase large subunit